jgi:hypothetical protein
MSVLSATVYGKSFVLNKLMVDHIDTRKDRQKIERQRDRHREIGK